MRPPTPRRQQTLKMRPKRRPRGADFIPLSNNIVPTKRHRCTGFTRWLLLLIAWGLATSAVRAQADEPVPIQRILVKPGDVAKELERVQQGTLIPWPLQKFDARLDHLRKSLQARETKARLAQATYSAELIGSAFAQGNGQWIIQYPGAEPALLPIDSLNLSLANLRWDQGKDALLGEFDGKTLSLLVSPVGHLAKDGNKRIAQTCFFDWSSRGIPRNDGLAFTLAVPACPISTFELRLPAENWLAAQKNSVLVLGPLDSGSATHRLWKVHAAGQTQIDLLVRKISESKGPAPTLFARVQSVQSLDRDRITLTHDFQLDIPHGSITELFLESDYPIQPVDVSIKTGEVKRWQWTESTPKKDAKSRTTDPRGVLKIEFHQPVLGKLHGLRVRSLGVLPVPPLEIGSKDGVEWTSPEWRVRDAITRGESLQLQFHADLPIGKWDAGTFQQVQIATDADGRQTLSLADTAANPSSSRRPVVFLESANHQVHTKENYLWQIAPRGATLDADIQYASNRGSLFELTLKLPKAALNYSIESLELLPDDLLRKWHRVGETLIVDLKQPLAPTKKALVKIRFRNTLPASSSAARNLAFPEIEPADATRREGTISVHVDRSLQGQLLNASLPQTAIALANQDKPHLAPKFRFTFRDQRLNANVRVVPFVVHVKHRGTHLVRLTESGAVLRSRWEVEPIVGEPDFLDFQFSPGFPATWKLLPDENALNVHHWERLHVQESLPPLLFFGVPSGMHAAILQSVIPTGPRWRFHLSEPLRRNASFTIEATIPLGMREDELSRIALQMPNVHPWERLAGTLAAERLPSIASLKRWRIPMMYPLQRGDVDQEIFVESVNEPIESALPQGFFQLSTPAVPAGKTSFALHASSRPFFGSPELSLSTRVEKQVSSNREFCDDASVTTLVHRDGRIDHQVRFRLWHWRDRTFALGVPPEFQLIGIKVHDHWLDRVENASDGRPTQLVLPFDSNAESVTYEILLRSEASEHWFPGMRKVSVLAIDWPTAPLRVKRQLCLASDLAPVNQESLASIGTPERFAGSSATSRWFRSLWAVGQTWLPFDDQVQSQEKLAQQRQAVLLAAAQFRAANARPMKFGEALEAFASQYLKEQCPLVIDQTAVRSLGINAETLIPTIPPPKGSTRPFWESFGMIYVPCTGGALLTSPARIQQFGISGTADVDALTPVMMEAILHGQDSSASFASVLSWLKNTGSAGGAFSDAKRSSISEYAADFRAMTQWQVLGEFPRELEIAVFDCWTARLVGWMIAALLAVSLMFVQRKLEIVACTRLHLLLVTSGLLFAIWSPASVREFLILPSVGVEAVMMAWSLFRLFSRRDVIAASSATTVSKMPAAVVAMLLALFSFGYSVAAQPSAPRAYSVLIVDGPKPLALLTPELIAKLDEWEIASNAALHGPVLVAANYEGSVKDGIARFDVVYDLHTAKDRETLMLPLAGVQLLDQSLLDGALVFPTAQKNAYAIPIPGKGSHQLRLSFTARVTANNDYIDLRFSVPKVAQNKLTLHWTKPVLAVHCLYCWGAEQRSTNAASAITTWQGQLGYENVVHLRWSGAAPNPGSNAIEVKEAHYWDLRPDYLSLVTSFHYAIGKNSLGQLSASVAEGLHIRAIDVQAIMSPAALSTPVSIKNWFVTGKAAQRRLIVEFAQPMSGNIVLHLEMMPQTIAVQGQMSLPLPAPMQGKSVSGMLGYRLDATEVRTTAQNLSVQGMNAADFEQAWKKQSQRSTVATPSRAYNFQRKSQQAALELVIQPSTRQAEMDLVWKVDLHHAEVIGKFTVTSPLEDITMVEFSVDPALSLADVLGSEVLRWARSESKLQVWLRATSKRVTLEMIGWKTSTFKPGPLSKRSFTLPCIYPLHMQNFVGKIRLETTPVLELDVEHLRRLRPHANGKYAYEIEGTPYECSFSVRAPGKTAHAHALTRIERADRGIEYTHDLRIATERGTLPNFTVVAKNWQGEPLSLDAPGAVVQVLKSKTADTPSWSVKYPAGSPLEVNISLHGRLANRSGPAIALPTLELGGIPIQSSLIAWKGLECAPSESVPKIANQPSVKEDVVQFQSGAGLRDALGWSFAKAPQTLKVTLPTAPPRANVRILSARRSIEQDDQRGWIYSLDCWIHAEDQAEMRLRFPAKVDQLGAWLDRRMVSLRDPSGQEFMLSVDGSTYPRHVQIRWKYAQLTDKVAAPFMPWPLELPPAASGMPTLWIPRDMVAGESQNLAFPSLIDQLLAEAETHVQISAQLGEDLRSADQNLAKQIFGRQQQFYACVHQAEYAAKAMANHVRPFDAAAWLKRIESMKKGNAELAKEHRFEHQRASAEKAKPLAWRLTPFREPSADGIPVKLGPNSSNPVLQFAKIDAETEVRARTEWLLLAAVFLLVISYFRHGISLVGKIAPEAILALIAVLVWYQGVNLFILVIALWMVSIRSYRLRNAWIARANAKIPLAAVNASNSTKSP